MEREAPDPVTIALRRLSKDDLDAYLQLEKRAGSRTYTAAQNLEEAEEEFMQGPMYFVMQGDTIVGSVSYSIKEDGSAYLNGLAIDPEYQGQGLGRAALERVLTELKAFPRIWLVTHPENERAIGLYESFGFTITDRVEDFQGDGEPRVVLTCEQVAQN